MVKHKLYVNAHWLALHKDDIFFQRSELQDSRHVVLKF